MSWLSACGFVWLVFLAVWIITALQTKPISRQENFWASLGYRLLSVMAGFLLFDPRLAVGLLGIRLLPLSGVLHVAGFVITVLGIAFAVWARFFLGGNWSAMVTVKENHELIRSGPYAIVRHPIYSGVSLAALGTAIALGEVRGFVAVALLIIAWRWKWGKEESFMSQQFGEQYAEYKRHVRALIPGIW
ncbi:MAG TPA: isoprenylcysteine carboxylmethyltransferase family protein [Bryobacteraceae bacterium]|jgi:protein-S-isoprenylcysteine O-methyltransferase Ste14|nr:isoprenylcysteine carboxylmethyltransferase family protein [Bryobacteraceae bacterium]